MTGCAPADAIAVTALHYRYPDGTVALRDVNLTVPAGSRTALMGANGAGKSTLLLHLNGLLRAQQGRVCVLGRVVQGRDLGWFRQRVGMVFQDPDDQLFAPTVAEDVAFGPLQMGLSRAEAGRRAEAALAAVGLRDLAGRAPHHLSYGQKKRVAIAGVLAMEPDILVLDEPMAFLDPAGKEALLDILERLSLAGKTILVSTHDVDFAAHWAERVIILRRGEVVCAGAPDVLTDAELVAAWDLTLPTISKAFQEWAPRWGLPLPKTVREARDLLAGLPPPRR